MPEFKVEKVFWKHPEVQLLKLTGPFTIAGLFDFQAIVRNEPAPATIVDLTDVPYMDSAAFGSLPTLHVSCQKNGRRYALVSVSDRLKTRFRVAGVDGILVICPSLAEAEARVGAKSAAA
jgi:anti-anti-sigma factor